MKNFIAKHIPKGLVSALFFWGSLSTPIPGANAHPLLLDPPAHPLDQQLNTCMIQNPGTTSERHCMEELLPLWEARLLSYYQQLGGDQNVRLKATQAAWRAYAAEQTAYFKEKYALQGTMYALFFADARLQLLRHRVLQLEDDYAFLKEHL
jgi:uncharacterized protein YecT (DUF1311 family)